MIETFPVALVATAVAKRGRYYVADTKALFNLLSAFGMNPFDGDPSIETAVTRIREQAPADLVAWADASTPTRDNAADLVAEMTAKFGALIPLECPEDVICVICAIVV